MPDADPEPPQVASRAVPKTVRVSVADYDRDPDDEPTGPPRVLFWFRLGCAMVAVVAGVVASFALVVCVREVWDETGPIYALAGSLALFTAYSLPLWWRRPRWWHWVYGLALLLPGVVPVTNPLSVVLLVFWCRPKTVRFFRHPPDSYAPAPPEPAPGEAAPVEPPGVLFALRLLCAVGCVACLLAMPVTAVVFAADPDGGWGAVPWLGGFAVGFGLFAVPLYARTPRPWLWWYGLALLVLCSLSLYFTLLAVPTLALWLTRRPRDYYAGRGRPATA